MTANQDAAAKCSCGKGDANPSQHDPSCPRWSFFDAIYMVRNQVERHPQQDAAAGDGERAWEWVRLNPDSDLAMYEVFCGEGGRPGVVTLSQHEAEFLCQALNALERRAALVALVVEALRDWQHLDAGLSDVEPKGARRRRDALLDAASKEMAT